jgi:hypothetical protein
MSCITHLTEAESLTAVADLVMLLSLIKFILTIYGNGREACVRFEVFTAANMKNAVFWDIKTHFVLHRRHITFQLKRPAS